MSNLAVIACASPLSMGAPICLNSVLFQSGFLIEGIEPKKYVFQDAYAGGAFE
jgi:hypothetical protein